MKSLIALLLTASFAAPVAQTRPYDYDLRRAIDFLNGRVEVNSKSQMRKTLNTSYVVGVLGGATMGASYFFDYSHAEGNPAGAATLLGGIALVASGLVIQVAGRVLPIVFAKYIGTDPESYLNEDNLRYFFVHSRDQQYRIASGNADLRQFIIDLAECYDFVVNGRPGDVRSSNRGHSIAY